MYIDTIDMTEPEGETLTYLIKDTSSGYITRNVTDLANYYTKDVTDGKYQPVLTAGEHIIINGSNEISATWNTATVEANGLMSSTDKSNLNAAVSKLSTIAEGAQANQVNDVIVNGDSVVNTAKQAIIVIPTKLSDLQNDSGFITSPTDVKIGVTGNTASVITGGIATLITNSAYNASTNKLATMNDIAASQPGNGILTLTLNNDSIGTFSANSSTNVSINIDLSDYVTNTALTTALEDYPTSSSLSSVATSGNYNDLSNTPPIPTVNNATLTIQKNGTNVTTFTANSSTNATANIIVPTKTSDLTNDSDFVTMSSLVSSSISGYDSSAMQTLKNDHGTLKWVTDTI